MSIQPLWLTHFIEILLVLEFQLTKFIVVVFSYKAHFRPQISSNDYDKRKARKKKGLTLIQKGPMRLLMKKFLHFSQEWSQVSARARCWC